jgi:hypothetical protein
MRCPACGADHSAAAKRCPTCGERTGRKPRRREPVEEIDSPFGRRADSRQAGALRAYRCGIFSLIPVAGLLLGPAALVLAVMAWREGRRDPAAKGNGYVLAALVLGGVTLLCNAAGLVLIVMGLASGS